MEIILKQDVENLGHKDDIVNVKPGYARNYLIPQGFAMMATVSAKKIHAENMKQKAHKETKLRSEAEAMVSKMEGMNLKIAAKTSSTGKIFGAVGPIQVAEAFEKAGFTVDRKVIVIKDAVKEIGSYTATLKLHREVSVDVAFDVIAE
jgi:large subunit ribosomal protein L9